jgi:hypothetical protein
MHGPRFENPTPVFKRNDRTQKPPGHPFTHNPIEWTKRSLAKPIKKGSRNSTLVTISESGSDSSIQCDRQNEKSFLHATTRGLAGVAE